MSLFSRSKNPVWLDSAREFCSARNITIMGWGPHALMVEAKSTQRAAEISAQLADLGFQPVPDPNDDDAGMLTLSHPDGLF
jgi:ABC-type proline/glycine betaine transport system substrate-binding protein